jgi:hypothetical protein
MRAENDWIQFVGLLLYFCVACDRFHVHWTSEMRHVCMYFIYFMESTDDFISNGYVREWINE